MARDRYQFVENGQPHFVTMTVVNWLPVFSSRATADLAGLPRYLQEERMTLYAYVITGCQKWNSARGPPRVGRASRFVPSHAGSRAQSARLCSAERGKKQWPEIATNSWKTDSLTSSP